jgi:AraC family transcriptional regulator, regulatory protein of adaptative response / DNA-3-methyladenine glycosylase II
MTLDPEICWRAWTARDARFVGRFVMGVTSTGIYCRPGCPARLPARRNVRFYASPTAAESAGFRACLRCRPDRAPGSPTAAGTAATVTRALRLIDDGALSGGSLEALSARLGVTSRWLRELFERHVGAAPLDVARTRKAHLARRLLEDTALPVEDVAAATGYGSARRLRAAMQQSFQRAPAALRKHRATPSDGALELRLPARLPFDATPLLAFLGARAIPGVEELRDGVYRRTFALDGEPAVLEVRPLVDGVRLRLPARAAAALPRVLGRVAKMFDLDADVTLIREQLSRDPRLRRALTGRVVRVPGAFDAFEAGVRAMLGQQVSVAAARTLAGRLVATCGMALTVPDLALTHVFPTPAAIATARLEPLGLPRARAASLRGFAHAVASGALDLGAFRDLDDAVQQLTALPGIGDWTAQYVAMRALGEPDAFPAGDLGVRQALARAGRLPSERETRARAERWRPWRAYAVLALWTEARKPAPPRNASGRHTANSSRKVSS